MTESLPPLVGGHTPGPWEALADRMLNGDWLIRTSHPDADSREIIEVCNASEADARSQGCKCPVMDNCGGRGIPTDGGTCFYYSDDCPMHGRGDFPGGREPMPIQEQGQ